MPRAQRPVPCHTHTCHRVSLDSMADVPVTLLHRTQQLWLPPALQGIVRGWKPGSPAPRHPAALHHPTKRRAVLQQGPGARTTSAETEPCPVTSWSVCKEPQGLVAFDPDVRGLRKNKRNSSLIRVSPEKSDFRNLPTTRGVGEKFTLLHAD